MTRSCLLLALLGATACKGGTIIIRNCTDDTECATNFHCETSGPTAGQCLCSNNAACPQDAGVPVICNPSGFCQIKVGCVTNADCNNQGYCDTNVGECVTGSGCTTDLDCAIGQICDLAETTCVPGCHSGGDCLIGEPCVCSNGLECQCPPDAGGVFTDPATFDRSSCEIGMCRTDTCAGDTSLCPYNDDCTGQPDGGLSVCAPDPRINVLCQDCTLAPGSTNDECPIPGSQGANFCLIDLHGNNLFCGVDCSQGQSCPSGYACTDVIILTKATCFNDAACPPSNIPCTDGDAGSSCPSDSQCVDGPSGGKVCGGYCVADEGNGQGFCTCVTDSDCPKDTCDKGTCAMSQQPCVQGPSGDAFCSSFISCVDLEGTRGCFIGRNCAPTHGLHCPLDVQQ